MHVRIIFVVCGSVQTEEYEAPRMSVQRMGNSVHLRFPDKDGKLVTSMRSDLKPLAGLDSVSYADAPHYTFWATGD